MDISTDNASLYGKLADIKATEFSNTFSNARTPEEKVVAYNGYYKGFLAGLTTSLGEAKKTIEPTPPTDTTFGGLL